MFICQTPGCAIAISKATFPAAIPCPVCQNILVEEVKEELIKQEDKDLISFLPYLIAYPLEKTLKEEHAWTKINLLKDTLLNYLKFLGLITASEFFNSPLKDKNIISSFYKNLSSPSFGSWNAFIRETLQFLNENNHNFFCPELKEYYIKVETGKKRKLYNGEIEIIDARGDVEIKKQQTTAIGILINFRNRYLGHGLTLDKPTSEKLWEKYYPIFQNLLMGLDWCEDYIIYKNEGKNTWKLQGASINQVEVLKAKDNIWLQNKEAEKINLVPFFIVPAEVALEDVDTKLLAYESYTGKSIKFFSPEGLDKTTSGRVLDRLNILIKDKQEENPYSPNAFTTDILKDRIEKENQLVLQTLIDERKVIKGIYQNREDIEVNLRSWVGGMANVFFIAAEAGSGKTNLLIEIQKQYKERELSSLLIRACRMAKSSLKEEIAYLLNIDSEKELRDYKVLNQTQEEPLFVLIDGINESQEEQVIWKDIKEISKSFDPGVIKFVVSCRVNGKKDLDRFELEENKDILYSESKDEVKQLSDAVFWLTPLNMVELEGAWNTYTSKNKKTTNPQFKFNDIVDYDRSIYEKIKNPLILRIFLETYHNKPFPKKGKKKLHIWRDWFKSFKEEEKTLLKLLAKKVWGKDNNELELEELLNDAELESFIIDDKVNAPFSRLIALGWLSRFNKDNVIIISFTVEGLLFYLLALYLNDNIKIDVKQIEKWLNKDYVIKKSAVESYLIECAEEDDVELIADLIDHGEKTLEITLPALTEYAKTFGAKKTIDALFDNPTDLDWLALYKLIENLDDLLINHISKELLTLCKEKNNLSNKEQIKLGLKTLEILERYDAEKYFKSFDLTKKIFEIDEDIISLVGNVFHSFADYNKAVKYYEKSLAIKLKLYGDQHPSSVDSYSDLGNIWEKKGVYDKAIEYYEKSLAIRLKVYGNLHTSTAATYQDLGSVWFDKDAYDKAIDYYEKSLAIKLKVHGNQHTSAAESYNDLGLAWKRKGENDKVIKYYEKSLAIKLKVHGYQHSSTSTSYHNLSTFFRSNGENDSAIEYGKKSLAIELKIYGDQHPSIGSSYNNLGNCYREKKQYCKAKKYYQKAYDIFLSFLGEDHKHTKLLAKKLKEINDQ
jgi:tetratricopeptide (TPR) repeat protein